MRFAVSLTVIAAAICVINSRQGQVSRQDIPKQGQVKLSDKAGRIQTLRREAIERLRRERETPRLLWLQ
jgi:hypothetical protein